VNSSNDFLRRVELVRQIAAIHSRRSTFTHDEELQFIVAARLFTYAELETMHTEAVRTAQTEPGTHGPSG
jgi:hypothetical protein